MNKKSTLSAWIIAAMMAMAPVGVTAQRVDFLFI